MKVRTVILLAAMAAPVVAQVPVSRWTSYAALHAGGLAARLDRGTLEPHIEIPLFNRATVGDAEVNLRLAYDGQIWGNAGGRLAPFAPAGWRLLQPSGQLQAVTTATSATCGWYDPVTGVDDSTGNQDDGSYTYYETDYTVTEPDGTVLDPNSLPNSLYPVWGGGSHPQGWVNDCNFIGSPVNFVIPDGKGFTLSIPNDDSQQNAPAYLFSSSGDQVAPTLTDRNGNTVTVTTAGNVTTYTDPLGTALTATASGSPVSQVIYQYTGPGGAAEQIIEHFNQSGITTSLGCPGVSEFSGTLDLPTELDYPDGTKYLFAYDSDARLNTVTLPTGATVHFDVSAFNCTDLANDGVAVWNSVDGQAKGYSWTRTHPTAGPVTTETSPDENATVYTFATDPGVQGWVLAGVDAYEGSPAGMHLVSATVATTSTATQGVTGQTTTTTLVASSLARQTTVSFDPLGGTTTQTDTDWGKQSPYPVLRKQQWTFTASGYTDELTQALVLDANSNTVAATSFGYDGRGNRVSESDATGGSAALVKTWAYNSNGTLASATDAAGNQTAYTYSAGGNCPAGIFPSLIQSPVAAVKTTLTWDCVGGVELTSKDGNGATTSIAYGDALWRPTAITAPDGGVTNVTYTANSVERAMLFNNNASTTDVLTTLDGLGRAILSQRRQGPGATNFDSVETFVDGMGRAAVVTMPYVGTAGQTAPSGTPQNTTSFDALSRPVKVVDGGGGEVDTSYSANDVLRTVLGSPNVARQEEFDGLGRLTSVCELTTHLAGNGACAQSAGQTGYWTKYTRSPLGEITHVVQNAQSATTETRSFAFDELGRLTSETNPETGTTSYVYDSGACGFTSNADLIERADAMGNVTCYAHDALHRVTTITYPSGPYAGVTPPKTFQYDAATVDGVAMGNAVGRLAEAWTGNHTTDLGFSYSILGQVGGEYSLIPGTSNWNIVGAGYYSNGALALLNVGGLPQFTYGIDPEGRMGGVTASPSTDLETGVTYNPSSQVTGLTLVTTDLDKDTWSYDPNTGRMSGYSATIAGTNYSTSLAWNADGSLAQMTSSGAGQNCSYTHDDLGRVAKVNCGTSQPSLTYSFDPFGNLTVGGAPVGVTTSFSFTNNRIGGMNHDANGNLLDDPVIPSANANAFDAEGKAVKFENASVVYDALGRAVEVNGAWQYLYGPDGRKLAVMQGQSLVRADIPLPGGDEAVYQGSTLAYYRHADWQGSSRLASTPASTIYSARAFTPYGAVYDESGGSNDRDFTGVMQDIAPNKYDFLMREYEPVAGRWFSPDPAGLAAVDPNNPQSWNRYAYVNGNPLNYVDPTGLLTTCPVADGEPVCPDPSDPGAPGVGGGHSKLCTNAFPRGFGGLLFAPDGGDCGPGNGSGGRHGGRNGIGPGDPPPIQTGTKIRNILQCAVDATDAATPGGFFGNLIFGNTVAEVVGLALRATAPSADVGAALAAAGGVGVSDAVLDPAQKVGINAAGSALIRGIAALQESGQITQLGLESVIEQSAPEILSIAGKDLAGPVGAAKVVFDIGQFIYEAARCW